MSDKETSRYARMLRSIREALNSAKDTAKQGEEVLKHIRPMLDKLPSDVEDPQIYRWGQRIDFNYLSHEQTILVIKAFGGKFKKEYNDDSINYTSEEAIKIGEPPAMWHVRIYAGKPPPNCKIVECGEEFVPGYVRKKKKLVCMSQEGAEVTMTDSQPEVAGSPETAEIVFDGLTWAQLDRLDDMLAKASGSEPSAPLTNVAGYGQVKD